MSDIIFELKDVHFSYLGRFPALCGISITIKKGQRISIIGANGSGKSTLLQILDGLIFPDKGTVKVFGGELSERAVSDRKFSESFRRRVGFVFQNPDIQLFCPTVKEDIVFGPLQLGERKEDINKRLEELTAILNIKDLLDRSPHQLSIGEKRKVAIASTLIIDPEVLILDEPTAGLDPSTTRHIIDLLVQASESGKTVIVSTHDLHVVPEVSDEVYVFDHTKKIVRHGDPSAILSDEDFLRDNNLVHIHSHKHKGSVHVHPHAHLDHHTL